MRTMRTGHRALRPIGLALICLLVTGFLTFGAADVRPPVANASENEALSWQLPEKDPSFPDIGRHWAKEFIMRAFGRGFLNGYPDGTFRPESNVTRAEFIRILAAAFGLTSDHTNSTSVPPRTVTFSDTVYHWASPYVNAALAADVLLKEDYPDDRFEPDRPITRLEMAVQLVRALGKQGKADQPDAVEMSRAYRDADLIPEKLRGYVGVATQLGIITGFPESIFGPDRNATRAQAATTVLRTLDTREAAATAFEFFHRWAKLDLEGMKRLMLVPPEKFIPDSDIVFAPFYPKEYPADLPDFMRAARDLVCQYDASAWDNIIVEESKVCNPGSSPSKPNSPPPEVRVTVHLGKAPYHIWAEMQLTDEGRTGWRVRMLDSLPIKSEGEVPPSPYSIEGLQPREVRDMDGTPGVEILGWAFRGEYEGMGPEPSGTGGLFSFRDGEFKKLWLTRKGPSPGRVWTGEGVMGHLTAPDRLDVLLVSRPAYLDGRPLSEEGPRLGLYRINATTDDLRSMADPSANLEKVSDVAWPELASEDTSVHYGIMAARPLDDVPGDEMVICAFCTPPQGNGYQMIVVARLEGNSLRVLTSYKSAPAQSLYLTLAQPNIMAGSHEGGGTVPWRLYAWAWNDPNITALELRNGKFTWSTLPVVHQTVHAAADIDRDGLDEFLVEAPRHRLQLVDHQGMVLWETTGYKGVRQAWMGIVGEKIVVVVSEPGADANRVVRWEADMSTVSETEPITISLRRTWSSPPLGSAHISSLWVADLEGNGDLEILVTSSDEFLAPADYFHVFDLVEG